MEIPHFKYHPDPFSTGSAKISDAACECCGKRAGVVYDGPIYALRKPENLCLWCIADGSARERYNGQFTGNVCGEVVEWKREIIDGRLVLEAVKFEWCDIPMAVVEEVAHRTPGFSGWQDEKWWTHCGDAAQFLGFVGDLDPDILAESQAADFVAEIMETHYFTDEEWQWYINSPDDEHGVTTYVFRCLHCGKLGGYGDSS